MTKKRSRFQAISVFSILSFGSLNASLIGNPADPAVLEEGFWISDRCWSSVRLGMSADLMQAKRMRPCRISQGMGISQAEMNWKVAVADIGWNIRERFDLHLLAGPATSVRLAWREKGVAYEALGEEGMFWGGSGKLILLEIEDTTLGVDFHGGGIQWIEGPLMQNGAPSPSSFSSRLYFWQIAAGLSQNIGSLRPYIGSVINHLIYRLQYAEGLKHLRFRDLLAIGMYEGCSLSFGSRVFLNIEARQFFESGLAVSGELRF